MTRSSKATSLEILAGDAGWRNYHFVKLTTEDGIVGWSEFDEGFGSPGVGAAIHRLSARVIGQNVFQHERIYAELFAATRPAAGGVVAQALGAIENALLDAKAKCLGVPCYELLGGKIRDRVRVYWSHCATWRINHPSWYKPPIEIDSFNPEALGYIRRQSPHPISSCETLLGLREFLPYFREQAMDVAIIDTPWNGVWQSMKIASAAEAFEVNVAPHNFYGHLCSMMNAHFCAAVPNLRIMEIDIDRIAWDGQLFTIVPKIEEGHLMVPDTPGWGTEPNEEALRAHPPKGEGGLLTYGRKS